MVITGMEITPENLSKVLRHLIKQSGRTQGEICEEAGISRASVSLYLNSSYLPSFYTLYHVANALGKRIMIVEERE